jgi:hypothetical protein
MFVFGGNDMHTSYQDMWALDLDSVISTMPHISSSSHHATASSTSCGDDHTSLTVTATRHVWREIVYPEQSARPSNRIGHCAVPIGSRYFLMYGGRDYINSTMAEGSSSDAFSKIMSYE